jgi:ABC-2 type transport system ATP-binding protein
VTETVLTVRGLRKVYGASVAVDGIDVQVERGEIFGLLGPNGAGKTTTLECVEGIRRPDGGKVSVLDVDPNSSTQRLYELIGVQLQTSGLPPAMRVDEAMEFFCAYHRVPPRYELFDRLGLADKRHSQYVSLSTGQQRRLALCLAVAHQPPLVLLDEPTAGLDVESRTQLHDVMHELRSEGTTIVLATHDMAEAEKMADRVSILLHGKVVASGSPRELTATGAGLTKVAVRTEGRVLARDDVDLPAVRQRVLREDYVTFYSTDPGPTVSAVLAYVAEQGDRLIDLRVERPTLEERFLEITQGGGVS